MSDERREGDTVAVRAESLRGRVRALSDELRSRRERGATSPDADAIVGDRSAVAAVVADLEVHGEELRVAEEELRAQLDELSRATADIAAEELRYRELFEFAPDPALVTDRSGMIREASAATVLLLGVGADVLAKKPLVAFIDNADMPAFRTTLLRLHAGETATVEVLIRPRNAAPVWCELRGRASADGTRVLWLARDVSGRRAVAVALARTNVQLETEVAARTAALTMALDEKAALLDRERELREELEAANLSKDRFLAILSHDLRSPLNAVLGWTSLLRSHALDAPTRARALETIERNALVQAELIDQLLDVSRITGGQLQLELRPTDLCELSRMALDSIEPAAQTKGVVLVDATDACAFRVLGDPARIRQAIANLLTNALKFTPAGGRVTLEIESSGGMAGVAVTDTGIGIEAAQVPEVFEIFKQLGGAAEKRGGLGLGLFIVRHIVELHGGLVVATSPGPGRGARFVASFPLCDEPETSRESGDVVVRASGVRTAVDLIGRRVLLVDDESDAREILAIALGKRGARVITARDAEVALQVWAELEPDVLVTSIALPTFSGYDLVRSIRALPGGGALIAIAVSGFAGADAMDAALLAGFDACLTKPVTPEALVDAVRSLTEARRAGPSR